ncbi:cytochrome P450 [Chromohalobacter beijerinckii]|uniref:cytochrome P450 n=1 Tax=Chromohalobacter beijerinckii TaxID=86179 RepID=UPI00248D3357|nr:cytochrome P450 [Chromohalobacter beijerinckii]
MWGSANRDEAVFGDPDEFRLDRDPDLNLLYGGGVHVCLGAPLARIELQLFLQAPLGHTRALVAVADKPAVRARFPAGGYSRVWRRRRNAELSMASSCAIRRHVRGGGDIQCLIRPRQSFQSGASGP